MNNKRPAKRAEQAEQPTAKRRYNSPLRKQQTAATRERIVAAGSKLVQSYPTWDWTNLTAVAVGERAGVSERTVQRYFPTEKQLRDAVLQRVYEESGIDLADLALANFAEVTEQLFSYLSAFASSSGPATDPTFAALDTQRREALLQAVVRAAPHWPPQQQEVAAAVLDIIWNPPPYERLLSAWGFPPERAIGALTWLIRLVEQAIQRDEQPGSQRPRATVAERATRGTRPPRSRK